MQQLDRRKESLSEVMRKGVNVSIAAEVLNRCINGDDTVTLQQERVSLAVYNKMVPSYAAIQVEHRIEGPQSIHDLDSMLLSSGLAPLTQVPQLIDNVQEKLITSEEKAETPVPPDASE
jgi:hypothetical protein